LGDAGTGGGEREAIKLLRQAHLGRRGEEVGDMAQRRDLLGDRRHDCGVGVPQAGRTYPVIMGDYGNQQAVWRRTPVEPGVALQKPKPLIAKLDPELGETGPEWAPVSGRA